MGSSGSVCAWGPSDPCSGFLFCPVIFRGRAPGTDGMEGSERAPTRMNRKHTVSPPQDPPLAGDFHHPGLVSPWLVVPLLGKHKVLP